MAGVVKSKNHESGGHQHHHQQGPFDLLYFARSALAGGICCGISHGALTPLDVIKTRIQLNPTGAKGTLSTFSHIVRSEGPKALFTGLGPTITGYFIQGWFKFGGVEFFKVQFSRYLGVEDSWKYRYWIYLGASASAEFIADLFLCPLEATRIRLVADPKFAGGMVSAVSRIVKEDGIVRGFYSGFVPILFKQIPYTMAKFSVQGWAAEKIVNATGMSPNSINVSLSSGIIAGVAAAVISHPADTLLSMVNKQGAGGNGSIVSRLTKLAREAGFRRLCLVGLGPRCVMVGALTAGQFA
ncbi:hypothetical protein HDU76_013347 [Blyttiomyces sp. JEL0837]|nr:hypothetical protein HDU76_013347 [Blyttiomyces sp. JEL0837]